MCNFKWLVDLDFGMEDLYDEIANLYSVFYASSKSRSLTCIPSSSSLSLSTEGTPRALSACRTFDIWVTSSSFLFFHALLELFFGYQLP